MFALLIVGRPTDYTLSLIYRVLSALFGNRSGGLSRFIATKVERGDVAVQARCCNKSCSTLI